MRGVLSSEKKLDNFLLEQFYQVSDKKIYSSFSFHGFFYIYQYMKKIINHKRVEDHFGVSMCANYVRRERLNAPVVHKNIFSGTGLFISHATLASKSKTIY